MQGMTGQTFWGLIHLAWIAVMTVSGVYISTQGSFTAMQAMLSRWNGHSQPCPPDAPLPVPSLRFDTAELLQKTAAWALTCSAACILTLFGIATQAKLWPHMLLSATAAKSAGLVMASIAAVAAWLLGGVAFLIPVCCVGVLVFFVWGKKLLALNQHLQELALRESGFELALAGTVTTLILANFPTAVFLLLSHCVGRLIRSEEHAGHPGCIDKDERAMPCCVWRESEWMPAFRVGLGAHLAWTILLFMHMRLMLVLDFVLSWYFAPRGSQQHPRPNRFSSFRHALRGKRPTGLSRADTQQ